MRFPVGAWVVTEIAVGGELVPPLIGNSPLTLEVGAERVSGHAGVNRFMGGVEEGRPGVLATTMMAGPPELMAQERLYLSFLQDFDDIELTHDGINLMSEGVVVLCLRQEGETDQPASDV